MSVNRLAFASGGALAAARPLALAIALFGTITGAAPFSASSPAAAKTPGKTYCFHGKCHRVLTLSQTRRLIGRRQSLIASYYRNCRVDRYNPCGLTSSGAVFRPSKADNAASPIYPNGTKLLVWNPSNKRAAIVRIDNAGPYWGNRTLDLSRAAADKLGFRHRGVARLTVQVLYAPTPREARYRRHRVYKPVAGYIGRHASLASAAAASGTRRIAQARSVAAAKRQITRTAQVTRTRVVIALPVRRDRLVANVILPAQNIHRAARRQYLASLVRLPSQLVRAELPERVRRALSRKRLAALARRSAERRAIRLQRRQRARRDALDAKVAASRERLKKLRTASLLRAQERAEAAEKKRSSKATTQTAAARKSQPAAAAAPRATNRAASAPPATTTPAVAERPKMAWRRKYFGMDGGSS